MWKQTVPEGFRELLAMHTRTRPGLQCFGTFTGTVTNLCELHFSEDEQVHVNVAFIMIIYGKAAPSLDAQRIAKMVLKPHWLMKHHTWRGTRLQSQQDAGPNEAPRPQGHAPHLHNEALCAGDPDGPRVSSASGASLPREFEECSSHWGRS